MQPNQKRIGQFKLHVILNVCLIGAGLLLGPSFAQASSCAAIKAQPDAWLKLNVNTLVQAARGAYESDDALPAYEKVIDRIAATVLLCRLSEDHNFAVRYRNFLDFVGVVSLERQTDHELGFIVPDKQYFAETRQFVGIPEFLLEPTFIRNVSRYETLALAKAYLQKINSTRNDDHRLIFFSYQSRHLGTPDNDDSYRRLLVVVPRNTEKGTPDKWIQFGITDPGTRARIRNVSVVAAVPRGNGTFDSYFKDFFRSYRRDGSITIKGRWELGEGDDNCTMCHKSGILPIFPVQGSVNAAEQQALLAVNERFRSYGSPRFGGYLDERKLGPGLSSASLEDRQRRFGLPFAETPAAKAMVCSSCHNSERLGALNWPMDKVLIRSYVTGGQMPSGHPLASPDRRELYVKLIQEYFAVDQSNPGILKSWLLGQSNKSDTALR